MALGTHWEWRGFGAVTPGFANDFNQFDVHTESHTVKDNYLWIPGMEVNAKFRKGVEDGLKFKRKQTSEGSFEVWSEDPDELFEFPIGGSGWSMLREDLDESGLSLSRYPGTPQNREETTQLLEQAGCSIITVRKHRMTVRWQRNNHDVLIEWAVITEPQHCISIGLENWSPDEADNLSSNRALDGLREAHSQLNLDEEPLEPLNYLDAVRQWVDGECI